MFGTLDRNYNRQICYILKKFLWWPTRDLGMDIYFLVSFRNTLAPGLGALFIL